MARVAPPENGHSNQQYGRARLGVESGGLEEEVRARALCAYR